MEVEDTYFYTYNEALLLAKEQNRYGPYRKLQLCYYHEKIEDIGQNEYKNLICLPINKISSELLKLGTRIPTKINLYNLQDNKLNYNCIKNEIDLNINKYKQEKEKQHNILINKIKEIDIDFSNKLRVYIATDKFEKDARTAYQNIRDEFLKIHADVYFDINDDIDDIDDFRRAKFIEKYKPHITININRLRNTQLPKQTINIIWFTDPTLILYDNSKINIRDNDYIYSTIGEFKNILLDKGVDKNKISIQQVPCSKYCVIKKGIKKEEKIIFVGSNFFEVVELAMAHKENKIVINELTVLFNKRLVTRRKLDQLADKYIEQGLIKSHEHLNMFIYPALGRLEVVKWLCNQEKIKFEIYGNGWENIKETKSHYKGTVDYCNISGLYNSAKYSLIIPSHSFYQKRLLEASACGCINIAYDDLNMNEPFYHQDNVLLFEDIDSLLTSIGKKPKKDTALISKDISYKNYINKIIEITKGKYNV